jgi:hypothetical protein
VPEQALNSAGDDRASRIEHARFVTLVWRLAPSVTLE